MILQPIPLTEKVINLSYFKLPDGRYCVLRPRIHQIYAKFTDDKKPIINSVSKKQELGVDIRFSFELVEENEFKQYFSGKNGN